MAVNDQAGAMSAAVQQAPGPRQRAIDFLSRRHRFKPAEALPWVLAIAAYFFFPDRMTFGTQVLIGVMFALSLDLILGYAGIVTLGHAAFFGLGAYAVGLLDTRYGYGEALSGLGAAGFSGLGAYAVGLLDTRYGYGEPLSGLVAAALLAAFGGLVSGWFLLRY